MLSDVDDVCGIHARTHERTHTHTHTHTHTCMCVCKCVCVCIYAISADMGVSAPPSEQLEGYRGAQPARLARRQVQGAGRVEPCGQIEGLGIRV
jgi:hypothetical protein